MTDQKTNHALTESHLNDGLCGGTIKIQKLCGGGTSWFYALCSCGYTLGASHQDDLVGMEKLNGLKGHSVKLRIVK